MAYSVDLRERALKLMEEGISQIEASRLLGVARTSIYNWVKKKERKGSLEDDKPRRSFKKIDPAALRALVIKHPDGMLSEYASHFGCSIPSLHLALKRLKITRKKNASLLRKR